MSVSDSLSIYVVRIGNVEYSRFTIPFIRSYCERHGYHLCFHEEQLEKERHPAWEKLRVPELAALPFVLLLDLDVCPLPHAPPIHESLNPEMLNAAAPFFSRSAGRMLRAQNLPYELWRYNTGVLGVPTCAWKVLREAYYRPHLSPAIALDQGELNYILWARRIPAFSLSQKWNTYWRRRRAFSDEGYFIHLIGHPKCKLQRAQALWSRYFGNGDGTL